MDGAEAIKTLIIRHLQSYVHTTRRYTCVHYCTGRLGFIENRHSHGTRTEPTPSPLASLQLASSSGSDTGLTSRKAQAPCSLLKGLTAFQSSVIG